jgi:hypothetical protein
VRYAFTATFLRGSDGWKLVALGCTTLPTPPPALAVPGLRLEDYPGTYRYGPDRQTVVSLRDGKLGFGRSASGPQTALEPIARDVFMDGGEEKNLYIFRRDEAGRVREVVERRKFNDLHMQRAAP